MSAEQNDNFGFWGVAEFMGHLKLAGYITEEKHFGVEMMRLDIPADGETFITRYFGGDSIYSVSPCSETVARAFAARNQSRPVSIWELQLPAPHSGPVQNPDDYRGGYETYGENFGQGD